MTKTEKLAKVVELLTNANNGNPMLAYASLTGYLSALATEEQADLVVKLVHEQIISKLEKQDN